MNMAFVFHMCYGRTECLGIIYRYMYVNMIVCNYI